MSTLFDLNKYHVEPAPAPNQKATAAEVLEAIQNAATPAEFGDLEIFITYNSADYTESEYTKMMDALMNAIEEKRSKATVPTVDCGSARLALEVAK